MAIPLESATQHPTSSLYEPKRSHDQHTLSNRGLGKIPTTVAECAQSRGIARDCRIVGSASGTNQATTASAHNRTYAGEECLNDPVAVRLLGTFVCRPWDHACKAWHVSAQQFRKRNRCFAETFGRSFRSSWQSDEIIPRALLLARSSLASGPTGNPAARPYRCCR